MSQLSNGLLNASINQRLYQIAFDRKHPLVGMLQLTDKCNQNCIMCAYSNYRNKEIDTNAWLTLINEMCEYGVLLIALTGGEPTIYPGFHKVYMQLKNKGCKVSLKTNGTTLNSELKDLFREYPPDYVLISVYGCTQDTYNTVCGNPDGINKVKHAIDFYSSTAKNTTVTYVTLKSNVEELEMLESLITTTNVKISLLTDIFPSLTDLNKHNELRRLSPSERACVHTYRPSEIRLALKIADLLEIDLEAEYRKFMSEVSGNDELEMNDIGSCLESWTGCFIDSNGFMQHCSIYCNSKDYNVFQDGFRNSWEGIVSTLNNDFKKLRSCVRCKYKDYCICNCPGRAWVENGTSSIPAEYTCKFAIARSILKERRKEYEKKLCQSSI